MSEEQAVAPKKKGLHPLAWVGIGCLVVIILGGIVLTAGGLFVAKKAKDFIEDVEENPIAATAEAFVKLNPELEMVESDREGGTITVREKKTGKEMTFDYEDIENGNFSFEGDDGEVTTLNLSTDGDGDSGVLTMTTGEGTVTYGNTGQAVELPNWLPAYAGSATDAAGFSSTSGGQRSGSYGFQTADPGEDVLSFYTEVMEDLGLEMAESSFSGGGNTVNSITGRSDEYSLTVTVTTAEEGTAGQITYQGPDSD